MSLAAANLMIGTPAYGGMMHSDYVNELLRYQRAGDAGTLTLSDWGADFTLTAPAKSQVVDYGKTVGASPAPTAKATKPAEK